MILDPGEESLSGEESRNGQLPAGDNQEAGELPGSLEEALMDAASDLPGVAVRAAGARTEFVVGGQVVAILDGPVAEYRLDRAVATAALRTPGTRRSAAAPDRIAFQPTELDLYALDRAVAWLRSAVRHAR